MSFFRQKPFFDRNCPRKSKEKKGLTGSYLCPIFGTFFWFLFNFSGILEFLFNFSGILHFCWRLSFDFVVLFLKGCPLRDVCIPGIIRRFRSIDFIRKSLKDFGFFGFWEFVRCVARDLKKSQFLLRSWGRKKNQKFILDFDFKTG